MSFSVWRSLLCAVSLDAASAMTSEAIAGLVEKIPSTWIIQAGNDTGREVEVKTDGVVTLTTLVPVAAAELTSEAIRDEDGAVIALKGEQLYARPARGGVAYCAASSRKVLGSSAIGQPDSAATDPCFLDSDANGTFNKSFRIDTWNATLFGMAFVSKKNVAIRPVAYRALKPADFRGRYTAGIKYVGTNRLTNREQFTLAFGGENRETPICCAAIASGDAYPRSVDLMGAKLSILNNDKGRIRVKIVSAMPAGPFSIRGNI